MLALLFTAAAFFITNCQAADGARQSIKWMTSYEEAVTASKASSKPIVLFFTGSDWCAWCKKLEEEALNTQDFANAAGDKFIFLKLDFPLYTTTDPKLSEQNKQLQKKFDVRSFPTIVVLDSQQKQIGVTGYRPGGGKQYAQHLLSIVSDYGNYSNKMQKGNLDLLSGHDLKQLYEKSKELNLDDDALRIVKAGVHSDEKQYFQLEQLRCYAEEGLIHDAAALALKEQIQASDPRNEKKMHYEIAVIEFEAVSEESEKERFSPEAIVAPLTAYMDKFGDQDKDNIWRLQMIVSQVYLDNNRISKALEFAQSSYQKAPPSVKEDIATAIKNLQAQIAAR